MDSNTVKLNCLTLEELEKEPIFFLSGEFLLKTLEILPTPNIWNSVSYQNNQ